MDGTQFSTDVLPKLIQGQRLLTQISELEQRKAIVLIESQGLFEDALYGFHRLVRKIPRGEKLDLILESHGGSIDVASAIASICRGRCGCFRVIAPFMAKSAATLLVLAADERVLTRTAQLGPVDPQVRHPEKRGVWFPAHAIKEALDQVETSNDPIVKVAMADKLDPFLIGAWKDASAASKQYVEEVVDKWAVSNRADIVSAFTDKYKSHGYPIDCAVLDTLHIPYTKASDGLEDLVSELHELCRDILTMESDKDGLIMMTTSDYTFSLGDFKTSGGFQGVQVSLFSAREQSPQSSTKN